MNREFFALYLRADGMASWTGPWDTIDAAMAAVPDNARSVMLATPLRAMTPGEKREAMPILEGNPAVTMRADSGYIRVYGQHAKYAHLLTSSSSMTDPALCGKLLWASRDYNTTWNPWLGAGSQQEHEHAASLPLCYRCGYLLRELKREADD